MAFTSIIAALLAAGASGPTTTAPAAPAAAPAPRAEDKVVCKSSQVIGSLVRKRKTCQTKGAWAKQSESHQEQWQELQGRRGTSNGN
jgi:predicted secreted protein